jgi:hypothetical protein
MVKIFLSTVLALNLLSGCGKTIILGKKKLKLADACPASFANYDCAPTPEPRLLLTKFQPAIPIVDGKPRFLDYVGGIVHDEDTTGSDPEYCGRHSSPPFAITDLDVDLVPYSINYEHVLSTTASAGATVDLVAALKGLSLPEEILHKVSARVEATWARFSVRTIKTEAKFVAVKVSTPTFNELRSPTTSARFSDCQAHLGVNRSIRLIRGISGYWVKSASDDEASLSVLIGELKGALKGLLTDAEIVSITPVINRVARTMLNTASGEHFIVIAMTFYDP